MANPPKARGDTERIDQLETQAGNARTRRKQAQERAKGLLAKIADLEDRCTALRRILEAAPAPGSDQYIPWWFGPRHIVVNHPGKAGPHFLNDLALESREAESKRLAKRTGLKRGAAAHTIDTFDEEGEPE